VSHILHCLCVTFNPSGLSLQKAEQNRDETRTSESQWVTHQHEFIQMKTEVAIITNQLFDCRLNDRLRRLLTLVKANVTDRKERASLPRPDLRRGE
jgi:hypothetical protein